MAGNLQHTHSVQTQGAGTLSIRGASVQGNAMPGFSQAIPASTTNLQISMPPITLANLLSIIITTDAAITLKTNSTGSPQDTISIAAGGAFIWQTGSGNAAPFAGNVTSWYVSTGGTLANVQASALTT